MAKLPWYLQIEDISSLSQADLQKALRSAGKAANQRLRRLEATSGTVTGAAASPAYKASMKALQGRTRYKERPGQMGKAALRKELSDILAFLGAETSMATGISRVDKKRWQTAVAQGYKGSLADFKRDWERLWQGKVDKYNYGYKDWWKVVVAGNTQSWVAELEAMEAGQRTSPGKALISALSKK